MSYKTDTRFEYKDGRKSMCGAHGTSESWIQILQRSPSASRLYNAAASNSLSCAPKNGNPSNSNDQATLGTTDAVGFVGAEI